MTYIISGKWGDWHTRHKYGTFYLQWYIIKYEYTHIMQRWKYIATVVTTYWGILLQFLAPLKTSMMKSIRLFFPQKTYFPDWVLGLWLFIFRLVFVVSLLLMIKILGQRMFILGVWGPEWLRYIVLQLLVARIDQHASASLAGDVGDPGGLSNSAGGHRWQRLPKALVVGWARNLRGYGSTSLSQKAHELCDARECLQWVMREMWRFLANWSVLCLK